MHQDGVQPTDMKRMGQSNPKLYVHKDGKTIMIPAEKKDEYMAKGYKLSSLRAEDDNSSKGMNKYGLAAKNKDGKFYSYRNGKLTGTFDNYNNNTKVALNLSQEDGSNFYIVSIFTEYNLEKDQFFRKDFFDLWEENAKKLSKKYQINYLDTEKLVRENLEYFDKNKEYFCEKDKVHQTILGNQITAKLIYNYLFN